MAAKKTATSANKTETVETAEVVETSEVENATMRQVANDDYEAYLAWKGQQEQIKAREEAARLANVKDAVSCLAHEVRGQMIRVLAENEGDMTAKQVLAVVESKSGSAHFGAIKKCGLIVESRKEEKTPYYKVNEQMLATCLMTIVPESLHTKYLK